MPTGLEPEEHKVTRGQRQLYIERDACCIPWQKKPLLAFHVLGHLTQISGWSEITYHYGHGLLGMMVTGAIFISAFLPYLIHGGYWVYSVTWWNIA